MSARGDLERGASSRPSGRGTRDARSAGAGSSTVELLAVLGLVTALATTGTIAVLRALAAHEAPAAARTVLGDVRLQRQVAIARARRVGLVFDRRGAELWMVSLHEDGDGDGIRARDIASGRDPRLEGPESFAARYGGAAPGFLPEVHEAGGLPSPPPSSRRVEDLSDPIRFGSSDIVSFGRRGRTSTGTLYLTDGRERQMAVVLYGMTGRARIWEYDPATETWTRR